MLIIEKPDYYCKKGQIILEVVTAPQGFWLILLSFLPASSSYQLSIATPQHGLVSVGPSFTLHVEGVDEGHLLSPNGKVVWDPTGSKVAVLINSHLHFVSINWIDQQNDALLSIREATVLACAPHTEMLLPELLSAKMALLAAKAQAGSVLRHFRSLPNFLFVVEEDKVHQLDWQGTMVKIIVTNNIQDRWLCRVWDSVSNSLPLKTISIVDSNAISNPAVPRPSEPSALDQNQAQEDPLDMSASTKTRCIADIQCIHNVTLFILFHDGSLSLYTDVLSQSAVPAPAPRKVFMSPRMHLVCQVAYPVHKPISTAGLQLLSEPEVYEMNRHRDYASRAVTLAEVNKYLFVNENVHMHGASHNETATTSSSSSDKDSISVALYHKIARSVSIVNGSNKQDIADILSVHILPDCSSNMASSSMFQLSNSMETIVVLRIKHILDDPQYLGAQQAEGAESLHNIKECHGTTYALAKIDFAMHSQYADNGNQMNVQCKELYKLYYHAHCGEGDHMQLQMIDSQVTQTDKQLIAMVFNCILSVRSVDQMDVVLHSLCLSLTPLCMSIAANALVFHSHYTEESASNILVLPMLYQDNHCPHLHINERTGQIAYLHHQLSSQPSMDMAAMGMESNHVISTDREYIPMPRTLHQSLLFNKANGSLATLIASSQLSSVSLLLAYKHLFSGNAQSVVNMDKYIQHYNAIIRKAENNYLAIVKNKSKPLPSKAGIQSTSSLLCIPELYIYNVRTKRWKNILLLIASQRGSVKYSNARLVKNIPSVSYNDRTSQPTATVLNDLKNHNVSLWEMDMEALESVSRNNSKDNGNAAARPEQLPALHLPDSVGDNVIASRTSSFTSTATPTNGNVLVKIAVPPSLPSAAEDRSPRATSLTSNSTAVSVKSQITMQHVQVLDMQWWGGHSLSLLTLRKSQHYLELISRDTAAVIHNVNLPTSPRGGSNIHHNVSKVHRLLSLPVGFIPKYCATEEVHVIQGGPSSNLFNYLVVIVGSDKDFLAYQIATVINPSGDIVDYNVIELWNISLDSITVSNQGNSLLHDMITGQGGISKMKSFIQQVPVFNYQLPVFKHLGSHYSCAGMTKGIHTSVAYTSMLIVDAEGVIYYVDAIQGVAHVLPTGCAESASSERIRQAMFGSPRLDRLEIISKQQLPLHIPDHATSSSFHLNNGIVLFYKPLDHVQLHKHNILKALTKFELLARYAQDPAYKDLHLCNALHSPAMHNKLLLFHRNAFPSHGDLHSGLHGSSISYMPSSDNADAWLFEHLTHTTTSSSDSSDGVVLAIELEACHGHKQHLLYCCGLDLQRANKEIVLTNVNYLLFVKMFQFYAQYIRNLSKQPGMSKESGVQVLSLHTCASMGEAEAMMLSDLFVHLPFQILSLLSAAGFAHKHFVHELEQLFLQNILNNDSPTDNKVNSKYALCSDYMLLSSFVQMLSMDIYTIIMSRALRQTEPATSRKLFPVVTNISKYLTKGRAVSSIYSKVSEKQALITTLIEVYEATLSKPLLHCSSQLLSLLCEALGGTESVFTIHICLTICMEYIHHTLQFLYIDSTLQCVDFVERLLTILYECRSDDTMDLQKVKRDVLLHITNVRRIAVADSKPVHAATPRKVEQKPSSEEEGGIFDGMRWLLSQLGMISTDASGPSEAVKSSTASTVPTSTNGLTPIITEHGQEHENAAQGVYLAMDHIQRELGNEVMLKLLTGAGAPSPRHAANTSPRARPSVDKSALVPSLPALSFPDPSHVPPFANVYTAHAPLIHVAAPLTVSERSALLLGALLADRLRKLLQLELRTDCHHPDGQHADHIYVIASQSHSHKHPDLHTPQPTDNNSYGHKHAMDNASPRSPLNSSPRGLHHGTALLLVLTMLQSPRACDLINEHLAYVLLPLLDKMFSIDQHCSQHVDYDEYAKKVSEGKCDRSYLSGDLLPALFDELPALIPFWHIIRLHKYVQPQASKKKHNLHCEMLQQEVPAQYIYKLAQLEHTTFGNHQDNVSSSSLYYGLFPDDNTVLLHRAGHSVEAVVRAIVIIFLLLTDIHVALSGLYILRNIFEDEVRDHIIRFAKNLSRMHRIRTKLLAIQRAEDGEVDLGIDEVDEDGVGATKEVLLEKLLELRADCRQAAEDVIFGYVLQS